MQKDLIRMYKEKYVKGTRVKIINMEGERNVPRGTEGTVKLVDDIGQIHVNWDNGSTLAIVPEVDKWVKL